MLKVCSFAFSIERLAFCGQEEARRGVPRTGKETMGPLGATNIGPDQPHLANISNRSRQSKKV